MLELPEKGMVHRSSPYCVDETLERLGAVLQSLGIPVLARIDHSGGAAAMGLEMKPTKLLIFGNAKAGTPLMLAAPYPGAGSAIEGAGLGRCRGQGLGFLQHSAISAGAARIS
jgi:uncharacterized protein (DUF302 family)